MVVLGQRAAGGLVTTIRGEPRFDIDYRYGRQGELQIGEFLNWIANGDGRVEVKRKRYIDLELYVEIAHDKGRTGHYTPSGISVSEAEAWAFCIGDTGIAILVPTMILRDMLNDAHTKDREERDGSCPTKGKLINLGTLLYRQKRKFDGGTNAP